MVTSIELADRKSRLRGVTFILLAAAIVAATAMSADSAGDRPIRVAPWLVMAGLAAINLTPIATRFARAPLASLLDDETTRAHRLRSLTAGFWAALAAAAGAALLAESTSITGVLTAKIVICAGLATALVAFAAQELRASR